MIRLKVWYCSCRGRLCHRAKEHSITTAFFYIRSVLVVHLTAGPMKNMGAMRPYPDQHELWRFGLGNYDS
jgi:hypothetical protein